MLTQLDGRHQQNFRMMLRSLALTPASPAGLISPGVLAVPSRPLTPDGALQEAQLFAAEAYGATLGLIYYRSLGDTLRAAWDRSIDRKIDATGSLMESQIGSARDAWVSYMKSGVQNPNAQAAQRAGSMSAQISRQKLDFLTALKWKKMATFPGSSADVVNDPKIIGQNPWSQSDTEFQQAVSQEVGATNPSEQPSFNYGLDGRARGKSVSESASAVLNTMMTAKMTGYLDSFLELGEDKIASMLMLGIESLSVRVVKKVPIADLIVDWIKDLITEKAIERLVESYKTDRDRRLQLVGWGWGSYQDPALASLPGITDFTRQVVR